MTYFLPLFLYCFWVCPIDIAFPSVLPRKSDRSGTVTIPTWPSLDKHTRKGYSRDTTAENYRKKVLLWQALRKPLIR